MEKEKFLSSNGRLRRKDLIIRTLILVISAFALQALAIALNSVVILVITSLLYFVACIAMIIQCVKRFHDLGKSGWYYLFMCIPFVNLYWLFNLVFVEGTKGPNEYGEDPKAVEANC